VELAEQILNMPVKLGIPAGIEGLPVTIVNPEYATAVGLVNYGFRHGTGQAKRRGGLRGFFRKMEDWFSGNF